MNINESKICFQRSHFVHIILKCPATLCTVVSGFFNRLDFLNLKRLKFSFLLAIPTIGAIACYQFLSLEFDAFIDEYRTNLIGIIISFVVAYLTIDFFIKFIERIGFMPFIIYRLILGSLILIAFI